MPDCDKSDFKARKGRANEKVKGFFLKFITKVRRILSRNLAGSSIQRFSFSAQLLWAFPSHCLSPHISLLVDHSLSMKELFKFLQLPLAHHLMDKHGLIGFPIHSNWGIGIITLVKLFSVWSPVIVKSHKHFSKYHRNSFLPWLVGYHSFWFSSCLYSSFLNSYFKISFMAFSFSSHY